MAPLSSPRSPSRKTVPLLFACRFFTQKHGNKLFAEYGITGQKVRWNEDPRAFQRWKDGLTGLPLVDANMRELKQTGTIAIPPHPMPLLQTGLSVLLCQGFCSNHKVIACIGSGIFTINVHNKAQGFVLL